MESCKGLVQPGDLATVESVGKLVARLAHEAQGDLDEGPIEAFRQQIVGNTLPTPTETDDMIESATNLGRYQALRDLSRVLAEDTQP